MGDKVSPFDSESPKRAEVDVLIIHQFIPKLKSRH